MNIDNKMMRELYKKWGALLQQEQYLFFLLDVLVRKLLLMRGSSYDMIDTTDDEALEKGITQVLDILGEIFKLVVDYQCELQKDEKWTVTSDKQLNIQIRTTNLSDDIKVYIDNIHTDATICSYYPQIDDITQDSMDDRIHNSLLMGFLISDSYSYVRKQW